MSTILSAMMLHCNGTARRTSFLRITTMLIWFFATLGVATSAPSLIDVLHTLFIPANNASDACRLHSAFYTEGFRDKTPWALQMYDATAKLPSGLMTGNYKQLGNYDECLRISTDYDFVGQACLASIRFQSLDNENDTNKFYGWDTQINTMFASGIQNVNNDKSISLAWLLCVPSSCNYMDVSTALNCAFNNFKTENMLNVTIDVNEESCHSTKNERQLDVPDWFYIVILILFLMVIISCTIYDYLKLQMQNDGDKDWKHVFITAFSLHSNIKSLFDTKRSKNYILCLDGLRFLSICWIIYSHTYYVEIMGAKLDLIGVFKMHRSLNTLLVLNSNIVTDTFLFLSGMLLAYLFLTKLSEKPDTKYNFLVLYLHRYLRLTPVYAIMIGFYATVFYKIGNGPLWDAWVGQNMNNCRVNWWTNLLYVNNYVNVDKMCLSQSWYLSVDMQLFWLSPIFLYPMKKFTKSSSVWITLGLGLLIAILVPFWITFFLNLTGTMLYYKNLDDVVNVFVNIYTRTYARASSYIIGLGCGYFLHKIRANTPNISFVYVIFGWVLSLIIGLLVFFGPIFMYEPDHPYSRLEASFYAALHRPLFSLCIAWITFTCVHGYSGPINTFLSWKGWVPLSKLSYSAYLCHYIIILYNSGTVRTPGILTTYTVVHAFIGNLTLTLLISMILKLCFEMPFAVVEDIIKLVLHRQSDVVEPKNNPNNDPSNVSEESIPMADLASTDDKPSSDSTSSPVMNESFGDQIGSSKNEDDQDTPSKDEMNYPKQDEILINGMFVIQKLENSSDLVNPNVADNYELNRYRVINEFINQGYENKGYEENVR